MLKNNRIIFGVVLGILLLIAIAIVFFFRTPQTPQPLPPPEESVQKTFSDTDIQALKNLDYSQYLEERYTMTRDTKKPVYICILVTGLGLDEDLLEEVFYELPSEIGLAFSPYDPDLLNHLNDSFEDDYETLLMIPQEPAEYPMIDPGPLTLLTGKEVLNRNKENIKFILDFKDQGVIGTIGEFGARFVNSDIPLFRMLEQVRREDLYYFEPQVSFSSKAMGYAQALKLPFIRVDLSVQRDHTSENIEELWNNFMKLSQKTGWGIASLAVSHKMLYKLKEWLNNLDEVEYYLCAPSEFLRMYPWSQ